MKGLPRLCSNSSLNSYAKSNSYRGDVAEWLKAALSKSVIPLTGYRGFESSRLRQRKAPDFRSGVFLCMEDED